MASTTSPNKNYELQGTGDNDGTWGVHLNADLSQVDLNLGGRLNLSVAGSSDVTLTTDQAANVYHNLTGVLTGNINYIFPATNGGFFFIKNATTGSFTLTAKPAGGTGIVIPQGTTLAIFIDPDQTAAVLIDQPKVNTGASLSYSGGLLQRAALTGDVTAAADSNATTLGIVTTRGDIIYRNATVPARLAVGAAGTVLKSDGTDPGWGTVSAVLDGISSTQGVVLYRGASAWSALATGTSGQVLTTQGAAANPIWADASASSIQTLLDSISATQGVVLYRGASAWSALATGTSGQYLKTGGASANPSWASASTLLDTISNTQGDILYRSAAGWVALAAGTTGQFLKTLGAAANPAWATLPAATGGITTIESGSFSGASYTSGAIPATYSYLIFEVTGASSATNTRHPRIQMGHGSLDATAGNYVTTDYTAFTEASLANALFADAAAASNWKWTAYIYGYQGGPFTRFQFTGFSSGTGLGADSQGMYIGSSAGVTTLGVIWNGSGNFDAGTYALYGVN